MVALNPDFRGADEIVRPTNAVDGWNPERLREVDAVDKERRSIGELQDDLPIVFRGRDDFNPMPDLWQSWVDFQQSKGRQEGSFDISLIDEWALGRPLLWLPQLIGSCVLSNTFRPWVARLMIQIHLLGMPMEHLGKDEFGIENIAPFVPFSYGDARKRANMKGSDGLWCAPAAESLMKRGVLMCKTPSLLTILEQRSLNGEKDFPEPQGRDGMKLYRDFGNWRYLDELNQYTDFPLLESPTVTNADQLWDLAMQGKPAFVCSMEAIHKTGTHKDGFAIHERNPRDQWAHNMSFQGGFIASDGQRFFRESNESWGSHHIYNRRFEEVQESFKRRRLTVQGIGTIRGPASSPPSFSMAS